jgi:hypothetical protein
VGIYVAIDGNNSERERWKREGIMYGERVRENERYI